MPPTVIAVCLNTTRGMAKHPKGSINLLAGLGVEGDIHRGKTTQHLYLKKRDPSRINLTQVHLLHAELHERLNEAGFEITPGLMGENITTRGVDLMALPRGARLSLGKAAIVEISGFREPCSKLDNLRTGLMKASFRWDQMGRRAPDAGVMAIVVKGGWVFPGDMIQISLPDKPHLPLQSV
jgi:MOSC domain-containing protein YiiM